MIAAADLDRAIKFLQGLRMALSDLVSRRSSIFDPSAESLRRNDQNQPRDEKQNA